MPGLPPYYSSDPIPFSTNPAGASHPFSPLFSLSPNPLPAGLLNNQSPEAGGVNGGIEAVPFVPQSPPPDPNQMAAYLSASPPLMSSIQYFTDSMFGGTPSTPTGCEEGVVGLGVESILHFPSYLPSPQTQDIPTLSGCSSPVPTPTQLAAIMQTISSPVKCTPGLPPIAGPKFSTVFTQPPMANTPPNFQGLAMNNNNHIFSPPPPGTPPTPLAQNNQPPPPQTPTMHPTTTKESLFARLGRKITKSTKQEHDSTNAGSISEGNCTANGWSDTLTYVTTSNTATNDCYVTSNNPEEFNNNNYVSSPVTKLANLLNEKLIITSETPGVLPLSSTPPPTTTAAVVASSTEPRASSCPSASTAVTPSTKSFTVQHALNGIDNGFSGGATINNLGEEGYFFKFEEQHHQQSYPIHQPEGLPNPAFSSQVPFNPYLFQVLCPPFL